MDGRQRVQLVELIRAGWCLQARSEEPYLIPHGLFRQNLCGNGTGTRMVTVYYVKPSHCNLYGNLNRSYTLALYQSRSQSHSHTSSVWISHKCSISFIWKWAFFSQITLTIRDYPIHNSIVSSKLLSCKDTSLSNLDQQILSAMKCDLDIWWNCFWKRLYQYRYGLRFGDQLVQCTYKLV